jgi:hypothetical protein
MRLVLFKKEARTSSFQPVKAQKEAYPYVRKRMPSKSLTLLVPYPSTSRAREKNVCLFRHIQFLWY